MGMSFEIKGSFLIIHGGQPLRGAKVRALDLRAGIALVLAAMTAEGTSIIEDVWQIRRGYENLEDKLLGLSVELD